MQQLPPWARTLLIIGIVVLFLLPFAFLAIRYFAIPARLSSFFGASTKSTETDRYNIISNVPSITVTLVDSAYLDFVTAKLGVFGQKAILDPRADRGAHDVNMRYTISRIRFELMTSVDTPLFAEPGTSDFASHGDYRLDGDTLVVMVWLNVAEIEGSAPAQKFALEDMFVRTAVKSLKFATGLTDNGSNLTVFTTIQSDIQEQLHIGMMPWPFKIATR